MKKSLGVITMLLLIIQISWAQESYLVEYSFKVEGNCGMCMYRIQDAAKEAGAETAEWDIDTKILTINIYEDKTSVSKVRHALALAGHDNGAFRTPDEVYKNLHSCCKYREMKL